MLTIWEVFSMLTTCSFTNTRLIPTHKTWCGILYLFVQRLPLHTVEDTFFWLMESGLTQICLSAPAHSEKSWFLHHSELCTGGDRLRRDLGQKMLCPLHWNNSQLWCKNCSVCFPLYKQNECFRGKHSKVALIVVLCKQNKLSEAYHYPLCLLSEF